MDGGENVSESVHFQTKRISVTLAENSDCLSLSLIGRLSRAKFKCTKRARTKTNKKKLNHVKCDTDLAYDFVTLGMKFLRLIFSSACGTEKSFDITRKSASRTNITQHRPIKRPRQTYKVVPAISVL